MPSQRSEPSTGDVEADSAVNNLGDRCQRDGQRLWGKASAHRQETLRGADEATHPFPFVVDYEPTRVEVRDSEGARAINARDRERLTGSGSTYAV